MNLRLLISGAWLAGFGCAAFAQSGPAKLPRAPVNMDFSQSNPGEAPAGWHADASMAQVITGSNCYRGEQCAVLRGAAAAVAMGQVVDATPYRGGTAVFRAAVRTTVSATGSARLFVRVHMPSGGTEFFDNMGAEPIITSRWTVYEIRAPVGSDARDIDFGLRVEGPVSAWIDNVSLTWLDREEAAGVDEVRALIRKFADARDRRDGHAIAEMYTEDGIYLNDYGAHVQGRANLASLWSGVTGGAQRTIQSVEMTTPHMAVVHVAADFEGGVQVKETFLLLRDGGEWQIRLHEAARDFRR